MTEEEREDLIYSLLDKFAASVGSISDEQKYAFIAGARSALVLVGDRAEAAEAENQRLRERLKAVTELVNEQAEDEGLWFLNVTCSEAYLQAALRELHSVIEGEVP